MAVGPGLLGKESTAFTAEKADVRRNDSNADRTLSRSAEPQVMDELLEDTLILCTGEFGRTPFREGRTSKGAVLGRDHYPDCYSIWMAGGGARPGYVHGASDDLGFNVARDKVHVHDLQATILSLLGFDHTKLTYRFQGRDFRLTDVHGNVVDALIA